MLYHICSTNESQTLPEYNASFFNKPESDASLTPLTLESPRRKPLEDVSSNEESPEEKDQNNNDEKETITSQNNNDDVTVEFSHSDVKYSRAFKALWTRTAPHEPYIVVEVDESSAQMKLREYFEKYPIEVYAPSNDTIIVVDEKKYKARNILGFFRRGVQLVDYSKDSGSMVIDTISTIRNVSPTSAVRKIPPGRISKLVHPELHLENYTNAIVQVGLNGAEMNTCQGVKTPKIRRRRAKNKNSEVSSAKNRGEEKVAKRRRMKNSTNYQNNNNNPLNPYPLITNNNDPFSPPPPPPQPQGGCTEKLASIESICNAMKIETSDNSNALKIEGVDDKLFTANTISPFTTPHFPSMFPPRPPSTDSLKPRPPVGTPEEELVRTPSDSDRNSATSVTHQRNSSDVMMNYSVESMLTPASSTNSADDRSKNLPNKHSPTNHEHLDRVDGVNQYTQTIYGMCDITKVYT